jgi:cell division protein FtsA
VGIKDPIGMAGVRMSANFHMITGQVRDINNIFRCVRKAGLEVATLTLEPLASSESVLTEEEMEAGVALVDIGGGTTDIAIFYEGIIRHTAVIPFGGNIITEDIRSGCRILPKYAEKLKVNHGYAMAESVAQNAVVVIPGLQGHPKREISTLQLAQIIGARMEEILEYVHNEIISSGLANQLIGGIVMTGGGAQLRHMKQLVEFITGMHCRIGHPNSHVSNNFDEEHQLTPILSTGVGLLMTFDNKDQALNSLHTHVETSSDSTVAEIEDSETTIESEPSEYENAENKVNTAASEELNSKKENDKSKMSSAMRWLKEQFEKQFKDDIE